MTSGAKRQVVGGDARHPSWSPSGSRLAFDRPRAGLQIGRLVSTIAVSGGTATEVADLTGTVATFPAWARDGIWFTSVAGGTVNIWRIAVDEGTGRATGAPEQVVTSTTRTSRASPSADGRRVLFVSSEISFALMRHGFDPQKGRVLTEPQVILSSPRELIDPVPSPDGAWLATILYERDIQDIVLVRTRTGETRRLTNDALREDFCAWAPDGSKLYFCVNLGRRARFGASGPTGAGESASSPGRTARTSSTLCRPPTADGCMWRSESPTRRPSSI